MKLYRYSDNIVVTGKVYRYRYYYYYRCLVTSMVDSQVDRYVPSIPVTSMALISIRVSLQNEYM